VTCVKIAGRWTSAYPAIDDEGQVVDVYVSERRAAEDAASLNLVPVAVSHTGAVDRGLPGQPRPNESEGRGTRFPPSPNR
jgi:hypothetical protein